MKIRYKIGIITLQLTFIYWFIYTAYFGFNKSPVNEVEKNLDLITYWLTVFGLAMFLSPLIDIYEKKISQYE